MIQTLEIIAVVPIVFILLFKHYENQLYNWMRIELNSDVDFLRMIKNKLKNLKILHRKIGTVRIHYPYSADKYEIQRPLEFQFTQILTCN